MNADNLVYLQRCRDGKWRAWHDFDSSEPRRPRSNYIVESVSRSEAIVAAHDWTTKNRTEYGIVELDPEDQPTIGASQASLDREMLEMAAKAARYALGVSGDSLFIAGAEPFKPWNPLADDDDAMRLAVRLSIGTEHTKGVVVAVALESVLWVTEPVVNDRGAATRRAIVRAAAEIGSMK